MEFIDIPAEQTTALTDALMAGVAAASAIYLHRFSRENRWKIKLWVSLFSLLAFASFLGAFVHGFKISSMLQTLLWHPLYISLGLVVAVFMVAVVYDILGESAAKRILPIMLGIGVAFWGVSLVWPDSFLVFIIYEAAGMILALGGYFWLACIKKFKGAWVMSAGILVTIFAGIIQAGNEFSFTYIWSFDHNGIYHLVQMVGVLLLVSGVRRSLFSITYTKPKKTRK